MNKRVTLLLVAASLLLVGASSLLVEVAVADVYALARVQLKSATRPACNHRIEAPNQQAGTGCEMAGDSGFDPVLGTAAAKVSYGSLFARARLSSQNSDGGSWQAAGYASFTDTLEISSPGRAGEVGRADFVIRGHAANATQADGLANGSLLAASQLSVGVHGRLIEFHPLRDPAETIVTTIQFTYGKPFDFELYLESKVTCTLCEGIWNGSTDATQTVILEIVEVQGLEPDEFSVASGLGEIYANVVPEPSGALRYCVVLGVLAALTKSRSRR